MKKLLILLVMFAITFSSCKGRSQTADEVQKRQTEQSLREANKQIGMPSIVNFQERKLFKQIRTVGQFLGKGIGYGIPASTQFTNPSKYYDDPNGGIDAGSIIIPQADPNGLFMPTSSDATC